MEVIPHPDGLKSLRVVAPEWDAEFEVYGACPVQAFGTVRGRDLYFRARHGEWSFDVADSAGHLPSDGFFDSDGFYREGIDPHNGYMPLPEAVAVVAACLQEYTGTDAEPDATRDPSAWLCSQNPACSQNSRVVPKMPERQAVICRA